jgi:hypothetical protein
LGQAEHRAWKQRKLCIANGKEWKYWQRRLNFQIPMALTMMITVFWVVMPCSLVERNQWLGGTCCLHLAGQETAIFNKANNGYYENWYTRENNKTIIWQFGSIKYFIWISSKFYISHNSALCNLTEVKHLSGWLRKEKFAQGYYKTTHQIFSCK